MSTTPGHIKQEFFRFAENTSVRGVSRILKARNTIHRILWSIAVVTSFCVLLWQLSILMIKYFTWPVDTLIEESTEQPPFPDVTICKLYPTYNLEKMSGKISWLSYMTAVRKTFTSDEFQRNTDLSHEDYEYLSAYFNSRTGFISNFPIIDDTFRYDNDQLIKSYQVYNWQWREIESNTCERILKYHWDPNYYACRKLSVPEECQHSIRGMTLILYIHNFPQVLQLGYRPGIIGSQATGVLVVAHAHGTLPNLKMAHSIGPGTENNIRLSPVIRSRLPSPYSDCTNQKYIQSKTDITDQELLYTKDLCIDVCFQQQVLDKCGCLSIAFQFTPEQGYQANGKVCGNLSLLDNTSQASINGVKDYLCSLKTSLDPDMCKNECQNQCDEVSYDFTISSAPWPHVSTQLIFAQAMNVSSSSYDSKFDIYERMWTEFNSNENYSETLRQLEKVDLIEKNFLQMNIFFEGYSALVLTDVPSLTADKMLGLVGGGLSLWLGISVMTIVEVFEFVCKLVHLYIKKNKVAERPDKLQLDVTVAAGKTPL